MQRHSLPSLTNRSPSQLQTFFGKKSALHITPPHKLTTNHRTFSQTTTKQMPPRLKGLKRHAETLAKITTFDSHVHDPTKWVHIKITSNWGNPSMISCGEIDLLTIQGEHIPILKTNIQGTKEHCSLKELFDSDLNHDWKYSWPPEEPYTAYTLLIGIDPSYTVHSMRVWTSSTDPSMNIKDVTVSIGKNVLFNGEFPKDFGQNIFLYEPQSPAINQIKQPSPFIFTPTKITIRPLSSYGQTHSFALGMIILFDSDGKQIIGSSNVAIKCGNEESSKYADKLLRKIPNNSEYYNDSEFYFSAPFEKNGEIVITVFNDIQIGAIVLLNPYPSNSFNPQQSLKSAVVSFDDRVEWIGRVKLRTGDELSERARGTFIFFVEDKKFQQKVKNTFPDRKDSKDQEPTFYDTF